MGDSRDLSAIVGALLRYVRANSYACDTAEGIRRWWFPAGAGLTEEVVSEALDVLTQQRLLQATTAADGHRRYRRSATDEEIAAALGALASRDTDDGRTF